MQCHQETSRPARAFLQQHVPASDSSWQCQEGTAMAGATGGTGWVQRLEMEWGCPARVHSPAPQGLPTCPSCTHTEAAPERLPDTFPNPNCILFSHSKVNI